MTEIQFLNIYNIWDGESIRKKLREFNEAGHHGIDYINSLEDKIT